MDEVLKKLKEEFRAKAAKLPATSRKLHLRKGQSSLHDIIKTKEQADRFMQQLKWISTEETK